VQKNIKSLFRLGKSLQPLLQHMIACTSDPTPVLRAKALKSLALIVDAEVACDKPISQAVLEMPNVRLAVHDRFLDVANSVREAALDLVGHHINRCALVQDDDTTGESFLCQFSVVCRFIEKCFESYSHCLNICCLFTAAEHYKGPVLRALLDTGVSVRKRALKIVNDMFMQYRAVVGVVTKADAFRQGAIELVHAVIQRWRFVLKKIFCVTIFK
jgi:hypothetical protein